MLSNSRRGFDDPCLLTTKAPFLGFSALIATVNPAALAAFSTLAARDLNAPQLLQCSIVSCPPFDTPFASGFTFATDFFEALATVDATFFVVTITPRQHEHVLHSHMRDLHVPFSLVVIDSMDVIPLFLFSY